MKHHLKRHHRMAIWHLMEHRSAALFAGLGLGKTLCALLAFIRLKQLGLARSVLIIAPMRVATLTWPNEIEKWAVTRGLTYSNLRTAEGMAELRSGTSDVYLINYDQLTKFAKAYLRKTAEFPFQIVIYDELTNAKSPGSKRINRVRKHLAPWKGIRYRWGLTGTPTPNGIDELFGQIRLLDGGKRLGKAHQMFMDTYFKPVGYMGYSWEPLPGSKGKIKDRIRDITLSLPSEEYADILPPITEDIEVPLPKEARAIYKEMSKKLVSVLDNGKEVVALSAAVLVNKLLQITGGCVYHEDKSVSNLHNAKLVALGKLVKKYQGEPVIIACNYIHEKKRILKAIPRAVEFENTTAFLAKWNKGRVPVLVTHPKSLGHGLNMQAGGRIIIWYSIPWSRELYDQLNGRVARTGQELRCLLFRILCPGTMDDAVAETLREKHVGQSALMRTLHNYRKLMR